MHSPAVVKRQHDSLTKHKVIAEGDQYAKDKLRASSGVPSQKRSYDQIESPPEPSSTKKQRVLVDLPGPTRVETIKARLAARKPTRYNTEAWKQFRNESLALLQPYYPQTPLAVVVQWVEANSKPAAAKPFSALRILSSVRDQYPSTEISTPEDMSDLMKALGFKWGHLHSSYYFRISRRFDVICHRGLAIPILHEFLLLLSRWNGNQKRS